MTAVVRIYHSAVVGPWRRRDRELIELGCELTLLSPRRWNEGGRDVTLEEGADDFVVPVRTWGRHPFLFVYDPRPIVRELRRRPLAVLDVHEEPASIAALELQLLARIFRPGVPLLLYSAENIDKRYPIPFRWIERASLRRARGVYCASAAASQIVRRKGFRGAAPVIPLGVEVERFTPAASPRAPGPFRVGYVGRLEARKGVLVLLDAVGALPDVELHVFGDGSSRAELEGRAAALGLGTRVSFHGYVAHGELGDAYRGVDVVAVPSLRTTRWVEQFGRVAIEAMACGVPVLVSDDGALPEVVGTADSLVAAGDRAAWRDAIGTLAGDPALRERMVRAGTERAATYSWRAVAARHWALYESVSA